MERLLLIPGFKVMEKKGLFLSKRYNQPINYLSSEYHVIELSLGPWNESQKNIKTLEQVAVW